MSERHHALMFTREPLGGHCPVCDGVMDTTGCRIVSAADVVDDPNGTGIQRVFTVECAGAPSGPLVECPCCPAHPDAACKERTR